MTDSLLTISDLHTHIGTGADAVRAVDGMHLDIKRGETFALVGESGCGKSMTALSIMRLLPEPAGRIVSGSVKLDGQELLDLPESGMRAVRGRRISMIFQEPMTSLNPVVTIGRQIEEGVVLHRGLRGEKAKAVVLELLDAVGIPDPERRYRSYPHQLSGGMKQRVMIAIALSGEPDLLVADEPTTALDVTIQAQVLDLLADLQKRMGMSVLLITHDLGIVANTADRVAVMYAGQIVEQATREQFFSSPQHPYSRMLFESLPDTNKRGQDLAVIPGFVPDLSDTFNGCRFAPRCDNRQDRCDGDIPLWTATDVLAAGALCHFAGGKAHADPMPAAVSAGTSSITGATLLEVSDLKVHFPVHRGVFKRVVGHVRAVDGVSMDLCKGETVALVGESGCGKTTVGKGILQLIRPTGGDVRFDGQDLTELSHRQLRPMRSRFQIIFQDPYSSMNPRMRVGEIIEEGMRAQRTEKTSVARHARVEQLLAQVGLAAEHVDRYPHEFSGGQRQRICIARALAVGPELIVCDEPTSALDVSVQAQVLNLLKGRQEDLGLGYLFITHDLSVVGYLAHRVAVMYLGRIVEQGTVEEVMGDPLHPYTRALLDAVPKIDEAGREVIKLEGDMPSPIDPPPGCHFHPRCPEARPECRTDYPGETQKGESHRVRCVLYK